MQGLRRRAGIGSFGTILRGRKGRDIVAAMSLAAPRKAPSAKAALQRVALARIACAQAEAARGPKVAAPHALRKLCKEIRGLLHMVRPGLTDHTALEALARDAARGLAPARDAEVMLACLDGLTARLRRPAQFAGLRQRLLDDIARHSAASRARALDDYAAAFAGLEQGFATLHLKGKAQRILWTGVARTWARARKRQARARAALAASTQEGAFDATAFHDWRKEVKRHWYQAQFLAPIRPARMGPHIARIDTLGEILGAHNDLDTLMRFLDRQAGLDPTDAQARVLLHRHALSERRRLARLALAEGATLLDATPKALVRRWARWWRKWRR